MSLNQHPLDHHYQQFYMQMKAQYDAMYHGAAGGAKSGAGGAPGGAASGDASGGPVDVSDADAGGAGAGAAAADGASGGLPALDSPRGVTRKKSLIKMTGGLLGGSSKSLVATEEMYQLTVELLRQQDGLGIGLTLDNIIVEVEPGGSVAAQGDLQYGDQIVQVDGTALAGRMLKDVIVPRKMHQLVVRYTRTSTGRVSPRRQRATRIEVDPGSAPRRIEELDLSITREASTGRLGFGIDHMNTVVEVDPKGPVASKLQVGDKIIAIDGELLNFRKFVDVVPSNASLSLRVARLRAAQGADGGRKLTRREQIFGQSRKKVKKKAEALARSKAASERALAEVQPNKPKTHMPALREIKLVKETEDTKIGAVFHRLDDAFDKSFFNVEGSSVQPIIKKVDHGSMAEMAGLVPGDVVLQVNGVSGLSNFQVVEMLRKGQGVFTLVVISGQQVQSSLASQASSYQQTSSYM